MSLQLIIIRDRSIWTANRPGAFNSRGITRYYQGQFDHAIGDYNRAINLDPQYALAIILGHTEMGLDTMDPSHPLCSTLKEIQQAAKRSAELTKQLLAFARKQTIAPEVLDLNETVESMLKMLRRLIGENIDLEWRPGKNLWRVKMDSILWLFPNGNKMIDDTFINLYYSR